MALFLYNTFTKKEEEFVPLVPGKVRMYSCGPTVYSRPHIGNYSSFLAADLLRRWLEVLGYDVLHVKNITDVGHIVRDQDSGEDKVEEEARRERLDPLEVARRYTEQYLEDERLLRILEPHVRPRATETIPEMVVMIEELLKKGHAYELPDGVYFAVETFPAYGKLSGNALQDLMAGARIDVKEGKKHPADFALWKKCVGENSGHILRWPSPWGEGFPGWHIECSAMSMKYLGDTLDIHTGGEDNIFPHHESEIAQSEGCTGKLFVRYWLHKRRIDMGAEKMSKSLGNVITLPTIINKGFDPLDLRYYLLSVHYRTRLRFTWKGLKEARGARLKVTEWMEKVEEGSLARGEGSRGRKSRGGLGVGERRQQCMEALNADLNTPAALACLFNCMNDTYREGIEGAEREALREFARLIARTFGCFEGEVLTLPPAISRMVREREEARQRKDFKAADRIRRTIQEEGYELRDTGEGPIVRKA